LTTARIAAESSATTPESQENHCMFKSILVLAVATAVCSIVSATSLGVNSFNLAQQYLGVASGGDGSARYRAVTRAMAQRAIADAQDAGARFLRVSAAGYAPSIHGQRSDLHLWLNQPDRYWAAMDEMVDDVGRHKMKLVLTLLWNIRQFPAITNESVRDLIVNPESASYRLASRYITDVVTRYSSRPEILFYEVANELNLWADLDHVGRCQRSKKLSECTVEGNFTTDEMIAFGRRVQGIVRMNDAKARIASGHSAPRRAAEHIRSKPEWVTGQTDFRIDARAQFDKNLVEIHEGYDIISVHVYPEIENARFGNSDLRNLDTLEAAIKVARTIGKQLYVGEFGDPDGESDRPSSFTSRMFERIAVLKPDYASPWVWQLYQTSTFRTRDTAASRSSLEPGLTDPTIVRFRALSEKLTPRPMTARASRRTPSIVMAWPLECTLIKQPDTVAGLASASKGVRWVRIYVGNRLLAQRDSPPYTARLIPRVESAGAQVLRVVVMDMEGRRAESTATVFLNKVVPTTNCPQAFPQRQ